MHKRRLCEGLYWECKKQWNPSFQLYHYIFQAYCEKCSAEKNKPSAISNSLSPDDNGQYEYTCIFCQKKYYVKRVQYKKVESILNSLLSLGW